MDNRSKPLSNSEAPTIDAGATVGGAPARVLDISATLMSSDAPTIAATSSRQVVDFLERGTVLAGRYEILENLGRGGMGEVYKAADRELGRLVALKVIRPELASSPVIIQRFKQELILARQVTHRNVIRIYDLGEGEGKKFITMEYIEGETLTSLLQRQGKLSPVEAARIIQQVCLALDSAHSEGVIHRDLKPGNIMQDKEGRILVMDFGLAHSEQAAEPLPIDSTTADQYPQIQDFTYQSQPGSVVGTVAYMAPEQALAQGADARTDLFALGIVFYELLTGKKPFPPDTPERMLLARKQQKAKPITEVDPDTPRALAKIVMHCLETERGDRYQSAKGLLADLQTWLHPTRKALKWSAAAVAVFLLAGTQMVVQQKFMHKPGVQHAPVSVLVADFGNETGDPVFDGTLEPALGVALEGASFISEYNRSAAHKLAAQLHPGATTLDEPLARLVATRENVPVIVSGSILSKKSLYDIKVKAIDSTNGKLLVTAEDTANKKDVLLTVGRLAARIRKALGDATPESVQVAAAETFSAGSLEAAHEYALGQDMHFAGRWNDAIAHYSKAVELDPNLGRAYAGIAVADFNGGRRQETEKYYQLALSKIDRMTDREKYRTRGVYYLVVSHNPDKAIDELAKLVELYPADNLGMAGLALAHFYKRDMQGALEVARRVVNLWPKNTPQRNNLGLYAMYAGDFDSGIREQQAVLQMNPNFVLAYVGLSLSQIGKDELDQARETWQKLDKVGPDGASAAAIGLGDIDLYQGLAAEAAAILEKAVAADEQNKNPDAAAVKWTTLAQADLLLDRPGPARAALQHALADSKETSVLFWASRIAESLGEDSKALDISQQLSNRLEPDAQAYAKLIEGELELKRRKAREAVALFMESQKIADTWLGRFDLGRAYIQAGAYAEADSELEVCLKRRGEATALFLDEIPTYHLFPAVYYYLGRAQEGLKSPAAADSFKTFLAMKQKGGADPLVADARRRIASQ
jgi:eukaryotic-like serine/threonine-protein kinase